MNKLKKAYEAANLNYKKELLILLIELSLCFLLATVIYFWKGISFFLIIPALLVLCSLFYSYMKIDKQKRMNEENNVNEFVRLFTFFGIFIEDGFNVYQSLKEIILFANGQVKKYLETLLKSIEEDKTIKPFIDFSSNFKLAKIKEVMIAIFQMVDEGEGGVYINQFQHIFQKLRDDEFENEKNKKLERLSNLSFLPLLGSGITMIMLSLSIVEIMGGLMNGL